MRGHGVKVSNGGMIEISGSFDSNGLVNGKGYKKWKKVNWTQDTCYPYKKIKIEESY